MERLAANIAQEQRPGKGTILGVVVDPLARPENLQDGALGDAPLGEFLQDVFAPLDPPSPSACRSSFKSIVVMACPPPV